MVKCCGELEARRGLSPSGSGVSPPSCRPVDGCLGRPPATWPEAHPLRRCPGRRPVLPLVGTEVSPGVDLSNATNPETGAVRGRSYLHDLYTSRILDDEAGKGY